MGIEIFGTKLTFARLTRTTLLMKSFVSINFCERLKSKLCFVGIKFQIDISKIDYFTDQSVKCRSVEYKTVCKMQTRSFDVTKFTEWSHGIYFYTLIKFQVFLISRTGWTKDGIYKGQTLVQWGGELYCNFGPSVTGLAWRFSEFFLITMCVIGKDPHI